MLVIKIDLERNNEGYRAVLDLLSEYEIVSIGWEQPTKTAPPRSGQTGEGLGKNLSQAIDFNRDS